MCGFVAVYNKNGMISTEKLVLATRRLLHRGPDDEAFYISNSYAAGFRRLKIIDLSDEARQPMHDITGRYWIVFNGEIYNYIELREELRSSGWTFLTHSDTEVLLTAFMHWGDACLDHLNGMYAFLIWDQFEHRLFGARDRFGEKPFYYYRYGEFLIFASEIKAIITFIGAVPPANENVIRRYIQQQKMDVGSETFFQGIYSIEAAHKITLQDGFLSIARYWSLSGLTMPCDDPIQRVRELFIDSVRLRTRADVPVGACLSGGLDSTSIVCSLAHALEEGLAPSQRKTFTAAYPEYDETLYVDAVNRHAATQGYSIIPQPESLDALSKLLWFHDEPFHSFMVFASYEVMRLARSKGIKVLQNGQGADELLAGYSYYIYPYLFEQVCAFHLLTVLECLQGAHGLVNESPASLLFNAGISGFRDCLSRTRLFLRRRVSRSLANARTEYCLTDDFLQATQTDEPIQSPLKTWSPLKSALHESLTQAHLPLYLRVEDRNSMAHSIESRLPMLDHRLVEFVFSMPSHLFMQGGRNKYLLREAMNGILPEMVRLRQNKFGFPVPEESWLYDRFRDEMNDILNSKQLAERGIFDTNRLRSKYHADIAMWRDGVSMGEKRGVWFRLACLELWFRNLLQYTQAELPQSVPPHETINILN